MVPATSNVDSSKNAQCQLGSFDASGHSRGAYTPNLYAPQAQAFCYTGLSASLIYLHLSESSLYVIAYFMTLELSALGNGANRTDYM